MIAHDDLGGLIKTLHEDLADNSRLKNELFGHTRQFNRVKADARNSNLDYQEAQKATNRITNTILEFIGELEEDDLNPAQPLRDTYFERILVVVADEERKKWISQFFEDEYFPNLSIHVGLNLAETANYSIVIFDNMMKDKPANWQQLLEDYLELPGFYLLYLGTGFNAAIADYPTKAYATNTIFSIYARLREMVEFTKYFPGHTA